MSLDTKVNRSSLPIPVTSFLLSIYWEEGNIYKQNKTKKKTELHRILTNKYKYLPLTGLHYSHVMDEQFVEPYINLYYQLALVLAWKEHRECT
jgi:hypothetical protein